MSISHKNQSYNDSVITSINQTYEDNDHQPNTITINKEITSVNNNDDRRLVVNQMWQDWLPHDWCIHHDLGDPSNVYYSNAKGKRFYSKEDVMEHVISRRSSISHANKMSRRRIIPKSRKPKKEKRVVVVREDVSSCSYSNAVTNWPEWLPQDWSIQRSHDHPSHLYYCSPDWKKFKSKDEVINHMVAQSTKTKQIRRKRKIICAEDEPQSCASTQQRRKRGRKKVARDGELKSLAAATLPKKRRKTKQASKQEQQ